MVSAIFILAIGLGSAFVLGLLREPWRQVAYVITLIALALMSWISGTWLWAFAQGGLPDGLTSIDIITAGVPPPFAINLRISLAEAALLLLINLTALLSAIWLHDTLLRLGRRAMAVLLIFTMALGGIVLTRDLFNLFVFFELVVIATGGLILLSAEPKALGAGFKYLLVSEIMTIIMLIGIIFAYHASGTLNIDGMAMLTPGLVKLAPLPLFLVLIAVILELKPFPANGWALDIYEAAHPAFSAIFSAAAGSAVIFAADKMLQISGPDWYPIATGLGLLTFVGANIFALAQTNDRRLLGYSSVGQIGLVLAVLGQQDILGERYLYIAGGLLLAHAVGKAGLFWLSGLLKERELTSWVALRAKPWLLVAFVTFVAMLSGLPPFPGFYAKWELVHLLAGEGRYVLIGLILFAALVEAGYLFRWFGYIICRENTASEGLLPAPLRKQFVMLMALAASWVLAWVWGSLSVNANLLHALPLLVALGFVFLEPLPAWTKNIIAIVALSAWFWLSYAAYDPLQLIFSVVILLGGAIILLASFHAKGKRLGFYPSAMLMFAGLAMLVVAKDSFQFFAAWEFLTIGSYFLIMRGDHSEPHALSYILFSLGGAFLILTGFALAANGYLGMELTALAQTSAKVAPWVFLLLAIGFMTKTATVGVHIWLPGAHAEAEADVSPMVSGILLKAGLFGFFTLLIHMGKQQLYGVELTHVLMWMGALSALIGNLMAAFQEDAKRLLAWSSIGQMGYALFGLAMMNHLGWLMALMFVINHYIYKSMLFLSVGGIAKRTGTRDMYRMGGLIALMPLSFIAVLIGIIAVSGVPPLSGFGGRWIFYNAILTAETRLPVMLIFLSGPIAFLYLFRLIHTIFLGQLKDEHRRLREAPFWLVLPQMIFVAFLIIFALVPGLALRKVDHFIGQYFNGTSSLNWEGLTITSQFGYWSPISIMVIIGIIFATLFAWLLFVNRRAQKVKQFNIVFAAERPYRPETTHFAWNFFAPYRKALGFLTLPLVTWFWESLTDILHSLAEVLRRFYTGNGQTYVIHLLAFVVLVYLLQTGLGHGL